MAGKTRVPASAIMFPSLPPADNRHVTAAQGWLELGNHIEANAELDEISPALRTHPEVLGLRWQVYAQEEKWKSCVDLAEAVVKSAPYVPQGWTNRSFTLHQLKRTQEAFDLLEPAAELFPGEWLIRYNLACYACQLGKQELAWDYLEDAFDLGDTKAVKLIALDDPDLEPFWTEIGEF
jgi:tetratricopeptide (TPR) repeat protein